MKLPISIPGGGCDWPRIAHTSLEHIAGFAVDAAVWLAAVLVLGAVNVVLGFVHLPPRQMEMMEAIHLNTVYATMLVVSAGAVSRLLVAALDRLGNWEQ